MKLNSEMNAKSPDLGAAETITFLCPFVFVQTRSELDRNTFSERIQNALHTSRCHTVCLSLTNTCTSIFCKLNSHTVSKLGSGPGSKRYGGGFFRSLTRKNFVFFLNP